jgi:uncharacterized protein YbbC (DUF1343 family)
LEKQFTIFSKDWKASSMKKNTRLNGIDILIARETPWLANRRFGLIAHPASIDATGRPSATCLREKFGAGLAALFSPEHGFFGLAGPGDPVAATLHPSWHIPVHSLYGDTRRPTAAMLAGLDALVFDLQDLSIRCYTYVSTLRYAMEAAAAHRLKMIVLDRTNPLAGMVDGPMLEPEHESFVGCFPGPLVYGLSSGDAARWIKKQLNLALDLDVIMGRGHATFSGASWISPSPGIRYPHTAWCYPITVGLEALPAIDYGRPTLMPFELIGATTLDENELADRLDAERLPGVAFHPLVYESRGVVHHGVRIAVLDPAIYRPVATAVAVLQVLQSLLGKNKLWKTKGSRPAFFDQLFGSDSVRRALQAGLTWRQIAATWRPSRQRWMLNVERSMLKVSS